MLETRFPRPLGDAGNPQSWQVPVDLRVVAGAWPGRVVCSAANLRAAHLVPAFAHAALQLQRGGATAIATSCGFLVLLQEDLQAALDVPLVTSSLLQLPGLLQEEGSVGVLTISATALGPQHLLQAGVTWDRMDDVVVQGMDPHGEFAGAILGNRTQMDLKLAEREVVAAACALHQRAPHLRTLVLECANMPPYAGAIRDATGLRVRSLVDSPVLARALHLPNTANALGPTNLDRVNI